MKRQKIAGFTLVEALIAATIFFASIAIVAEAYRVSLAASRKAESTATLLAPLPLLVSQVADRLRENPTGDRLDERGVVLGVEYAIVARARPAAAPLERFDLDSGARVRYTPRFKLFDVEIRLSVSGAQRVFSYRELTWLPPEVVS